MHILPKTLNGNNNNKKTNIRKHALFSRMIEYIQRERNSMSFFLKDYFFFLKYKLNYFLLRWFEPFVMQWLNENDDMSMEYLHNALEKDRQTGVNFFFLNKISNILKIVSTNI